MTNHLVCEGVLSEIVTDHISFDFDRVPVFTTVAINDGTAHLWDDDAVSEMGLDTLWLLTLWGDLLGLSKLLDESIVFAMNSVLESSLLSGFHEANNLVHVHIEKLIKLNTSVNLLLEWFLLWNDFRHSNYFLKVDALSINNNTPSIFQHYILNKERRN